MPTHRHRHLKSKALVSLSQQSNFSPPHFTLISSRLPFISYLYYTCCAALSEPFHLCLYLQKLPREILWGSLQPEKGPWEEVAQVQKTQIQPGHWLNPPTQGLVGGRRRLQWFWRVSVPQGELSLNEASWLMKPGGLMHTELQVFPFKLNIIWDTYPKTGWTELRPPVQHQRGTAASTQLHRGREKAMRATTSLSD